MDNQPTNLGALLRRHLSKPIDKKPDVTIGFVDMMIIARCIQGESLLETKRWFEAFCELTGRKCHHPWTLYEAGNAIKQYLEYMNNPMGDDNE